VPAAIRKDGVVPLNVDVSKTKFASSIIRRLCQPDGVIVGKIIIENFDLKLLWIEGLVGLRLEPEPRRAGPQIF
jgi:hypothetical protein